MKAPAIRSLADLSRALAPTSRLLCLYSGGLDGTYLLHYLANLGYTDVTALTVDLGGDLDPEVVKAVCSRLGVRWLLLDRRQEFARDFVMPAIAAQAHYLGGHPICASLSRPLMAKVACEVAGDIGCNMIIHTSNRSQNSLRRFNGALAALGFGGHFGSPFELSPVGRDQKIQLLRAAGIDALEHRVHSTDSNLWGREFESGDLDDPENLVVPEELYRWTRSSANTQTETVDITFAQGVPVGLNGASADFLHLVSHLNLRAGQYSLGRYAGLEEIADGAKVQEVREMPAAYVLLDAYRRLESACVSAACIREKMHIEQLWVAEAVEGRWYGPLREAAQAFIRQVAKQVSGTVSYQLSLRTLNLRYVRADHPLYIRDRSAYEQSTDKQE